MANKTPILSCYMSPKKRQAFSSLASAASRGIWLILCDKASHASSWKLTGTIEELSLLAHCSQDEFQIFLDDCRRLDLMEIWTNGDRIKVVCRELDAAMERRERKRAQTRARMQRYRGKRKKRDEVEMDGAERVPACPEPRNDAEMVTRNTETVTHYTSEIGSAEGANQARMPFCQCESRFKVHEDNNVVVVVVVSYKDKQQLQPTAIDGAHGPEVPKSVSPPKNGGTIQVPFIPFPGTTLPPIQLVMSGISPAMPKPQVIVDNTKTPKERDLERLRGLLPSELQIPKCISVIEKLYEEVGFGYLKAQIEYVLEKNYDGAMGFRGYLGKAVRKNFAEYTAPATPVACSQSDEDERRKRIHNQKTGQAAAAALKQIKTQPGMEQQLIELERAALDRFPRCREMGLMDFAMKQIIMEWIDGGADVNREPRSMESSG